MSDPILEAAARALESLDDESCGLDDCADWYQDKLRQQAAAVLTAVTPLIEAAALRDALLAVDGCPPVDTDGEWIEKSVAMAALRAVLTKEQP